MGASITLGAPVVAVQPGATASIELRIRNTGSIVDEFVFDVLGDAASWAGVEPPKVSLFPGAEETARVVFRPPRAATTPAGQLPFGVRAQSREDPQGSAVEEGIVDVAPFQEPFAELVPRTSRGSRGAGYDLAVDNRGNVRLNAEVEASDDDRLLRFDVKPPALVVEPGMAGFAKVRVSPASRFWRGQPKTRPFKLRVVPEGYAPLQLDGTLLQESLLPSWFVKALLLALMALIALIILWLFVLKPTIETAASEAVESPIADLRDDVNTALEDAGLPTLAPDGGAGGPTPTPAAPTPTPEPGATPTPTPTPGTAVIPGLGNPIDGRLNDAEKSVTASGTLFITDLVFSNPNGREGAVVLMRDGATLLELRLENFRDLDFHFVTPIVLTTGQSLNLSLACLQPAGVPPVPCDPAVFYSGYLRP